MKKYKVIRTKMFNESLKKAPKKVQKEALKMLDKLAENPFIGKPAGEEGLYFIRCKALEREFKLEHNEVLSLVLSNYEWFEKFNPVPLLMK